MLMVFVAATWAQSSVADDQFRRQQDNDQLRRQQEQLDQRRQFFEAITPSTPEAPQLPLGRRIPVESPCRVIHHVVLIAPQHLQQSLKASLNAPDRDGADNPEGQCLGAQGIQILVHRVQNRLIELGYLSSTVQAPPQDLTRGKLELVVTMGLVGGIEVEGNGIRPSSTAMAFKAGEALNLRDIEQTLDNLRRIPGSDAKFAVAPGIEVNTSTIAIQKPATPPLRVSLGLDDAGGRSTGQWQASATLHWDNPSGNADQFYVSVNPSVAGKEPGPRSNRNNIAHYSIPFGYWLLSMTSSRGAYMQTVAGAFQSYTYRGTSSLDELELSRVLHRDANSITSASVKGFSRRSRNYIDDTEVEVQRRQIGGWEWGLSHTQFFESGTLVMDWSFRRGTGAFGAQPAPEELFGEGTSRMRLHQLTASWQQGIEAFGLHARYQTMLKLQHNQTPLTPQDQFCAGGRYTVRGTDGRQSLCSTRGMLWRNEVSIQLPATNWHTFLAADLARLHRSPLNPPSHLVGAALGLRGGGNLIGGAAHIEMFVGAPLHTPPSFQTAAYTTGLQLHWQF